MQRIKERYKNRLQIQVFPCRKFVKKFTKIDFVGSSITGDFRDKKSWLVPPKPLTNSWATGLQPARKPVGSQGSGKQLAYTPTTGFTEQNRRLLRADKIDSQLTSETLTGFNAAR